MRALWSDGQNCSHNVFQICWTYQPFFWTCQKTRDGRGCPKFAAGKVFRQISTLLDNYSPIFRQHKMLFLPRFGHFAARKMAAGKSALPSGLSFSEFNPVLTSNEPLSTSTLLRSARNTVGKCAGPTWSKLIKGGCFSKKAKCSKMTTNLAKLVQLSHIGTKLVQVGPVHPVPPYSAHSRFASFQKNPRVRKIICPQFWGRKWPRQICGRLENAFSLEEKPSIKFLVLGGGYFGFWGGGSADFIFMGARIFLICLTSI